MGKLGVGVGDEFPADEVRREEVRRDDDGVVHHHHYYRRRGGFLRIILWIMLISAVSRGFYYATNPYAWGDQHRWSDRHAWAWPVDNFWNSYFAFAGLALFVLAVGGALWLLRCRDEDRRQR